MSWARFWDLVHQVRSNIRIGMTTDRAKEQAREMFHLAAIELQLKGARR